MRYHSSRSAPWGNWPRYELGALVAITLLASLLRFYQLGAWSFWTDEIFTVGRAQSSLNLDTIIGTWPPISILLTGGALKLLGVSEWTARLVPAIIGIASIPVLYWPTRNMLGITNARVAVLLLAISPWHLYWSQNARFYTALLLLYTLALFAFYFGIEKDRPAYLLASLAFTFIASRERFMALFFVPVVGTYLLLLKLLPFEKPAGLRARNVGLLLLIGLAAILVDISRYFVVHQSYFYDSLTDFLGRPINDPFRLTAFIASNLGVPLATLASFSVVYLLLGRSRSGLFLAIAAIVPVLLLLTISPFIFTKDRYVFVTLFCWLMLAAGAVEAVLSQLKGPARVLAVGVAIMLIVDATWDNVQYFQINNGNRPDWKGAFALVQDRRESGDIVVTTWPELAAYYLGEIVPRMRDVRPDTVTSSGKRYWFVLEAESAWPSGSIFPWIRQHGQLIDIRYLRVPEDISLWIYLYDPAHSAGP
jgi:mannosyltransferase